MIRIGSGIVGAPKLDAAPGVAVTLSDSVTNPAPGSRTWRVRTFPGAISITPTITPSGSINVNATFTPDASLDGCGYVLQMRRTETDGSINDQFAFVGVPDANGLILPPAGVDSLALNIDGMGSAAAPSTAMDHGYMGTAVAGTNVLLEAWLRQVRTDVTTTTTAPRAVKVASTGNLTLSGIQTIDGVAGVTGDVLVKDQTTASQNGIYKTSSGAWTRAADAATAEQLPFGKIVNVRSGTANKGRTHVLVTSPIVIGTTAIKFIPLSDKIDARIFAAADDSTNDATALATAHVVAKNVRYSKGTYRIATDVTLGSASSTHSFPADATIHVAGAAHLTVAGVIDAPPNRQIFSFDADATIEFTGVAGSVIHAGWFGALADGRDETDALSRAFAAAAAWPTIVKRVQLLPGVHLHAPGLVLPSGVRVIGGGAGISGLSVGKATVLRCNAAGAAGVIALCRSSHFSDIVFDGNLLADNTLQFQYLATDLVFDRCIVMGAVPTTGTLVDFPGTLEIDNIRFYHCYILQNPGNFSSTKCLNAIHNVNSNAFDITLYDCWVSNAQYLFHFSAGSVNMVHGQVFHWTSACIRVESVAQTFTFDDVYNEGDTAPFLQQVVNAGVAQANPIILKSLQLNGTTDIQIVGTQPVIMQQCRTGGNVQIVRDATWGKYRPVSRETSFLTVGKGFTGADATWIEHDNDIFTTSGGPVRLSRRQGVAVTLVETGLDADLTTTPDDGDHYYSGTLTANRTVTLATTNMQRGQVKRFCRAGAGDAFSWIITWSGGTLYTLTASGVTWCDVIFDGSQWVRDGSGYGPSPTMGDVTVTSLTSTGAITATNGTFSGTVRSSALGTGIVHSSSVGNFSSSAIVDADVSASAAIAGSKISPAFGAQALTASTGDFSGTITGVDGTFSGTVRSSALGTGIVHSSSVGNFTSSVIVNADVSSSAAIAGSKISPAFGSQALTASTGDFSGLLTSAGATISGTVRSSALGTGIVHSSSVGNFTSSTIVDADVSASAAIAGTKITPTFGAVAVSGGAAAFSSMASAGVVSGTVASFTQLQLTSGTTITYNADGPFTLIAAQHTSGVGGTLTYGGQKGASGFVGGVTIVAGGAGGTSGTNLAGAVQLELGATVGNASANCDWTIGGTAFATFKKSTSTICTLSTASLTLAITSASTLTLTGAASGSFSVTTGTLSLQYNGTTRIAVNTTGIGFYGVTPVAQATRVAQLTDSTGGSTASNAGALVDVGAVFSQANTNDNFAKLAAKINAIETVIHNIGLTT